MSRYKSTSTGTTDAMFVTLLVAYAAAQPSQDTPSFVPPAFDCGMRNFALDYAKRLKLGPPGYDLQTVADALKVGPGLKCAMTSDPMEEGLGQDNRGLDSSADADIQIYVDPVSGNDINTGTKEKPVKTIGRAVNISRTVPSRTSNSISINLLGGTHWLHGSTIELDHRDSGLTISGDPRQSAIISGGVKLDIPSSEWKRWGPSNQNIWVADVSQFGLDDIPGLRYYENGERVVRARHPNGDPERMGLYTTPSGWVAGAETWLPGIAANPPLTPPVEVLVTTPSRAEAYAVYPFYTNALGGLCNGLFTPNASFWCNPRNPRDGARGIWNGPGGLVYNDTSKIPKANWTDRAIIHSWHNGGHWASQMYQVDSHESNGTGGTLKWTKGGFQDARADPIGAEWYAENVKDFLDSPNEFYYEPETEKLYVFSNTSGPPAGIFVATQLQTLLSIKGTKISPAKGIKVMGVTFRDTAQTFMEPHGVPSCGDWALQRMAGVFIEGTEATMIDNCSFIRMDGNGLMLSKYNRNVTIMNSEFSFIGDTAMAAWGYTDEFTDNGTKGFDATDGNFPRFTSILHNVVREIGLWEKQSSAWFQAKSMQTTIQGNMFFNGPRAGINFNDGFGGGNVIDSNLQFNFCRESSDHGPFNSWDRNMYLVKQPNDGGTPAVIPQFNKIQRNLWIANYGSQEAVDNDDGSGFYHTMHNFLVYGNYGMKVDMAGHDNFHENNLYAYLGSVCFVDLGGGEAVPSHRDAFVNNTCIQGQNVGTYAGINCNANASWPRFANNTVYNAAGTTSVCGVPLSKWQEQGHDPGSVVIKGIPGVKDILDMASSALLI